MSGLSKPCGSRDESKKHLTCIGRGSVIPTLAGYSEITSEVPLLAPFNTTGQPEDFGPQLLPMDRRCLANELALFAKKLGRLDEAWNLRQASGRDATSLIDHGENAMRLDNRGLLALQLGKLREVHAVASTSLTAALEAAEVDKSRYADWLCERWRRIYWRHSDARPDFAAATNVNGGPLVSLDGVHQSRHYLDLGNIGAALRLCSGSIEAAIAKDRNYESASHHALLARIDLVEGKDPTSRLGEIRI